MEDLIKEYLNYCELKGKATLTIRDYRSYLNRFAKYLETDNAHDITLDIVDGFHAELVKAQLSRHTQSYYLICIRGFLKWLRVRKDMDVLDPEKIELPTARRNFLDALSDDEIKALLKATNIKMDGKRKDKDLYDEGFRHAEYMIRARAIIEILLGSGVRVSELCNLKVTDVDLKEKNFYVVGKGDKKRICFLNDTTVFWLQKYLATRRNDIIYLFSRYMNVNNSEKLSTRSVERLTQDFGKKAGIKKPVTPHTLRRTYAAQLLKKGVDLRYIQELMGHESIVTTTFYTKIVQAELENIFRKANKKQVKNVKESEQVILSRESFNKLTGMVGKTVEQQAKILKRLEKEEKVKKKEIEKPLISLRKPISIN